MKAMDFILIGNKLYKQGKDHQLWLCANKKEYLPILDQSHASIASGHFSANITTKAILMSKIWWLILFQDANAYVQACDECQRFKNSIRSHNMPLHPLAGARAFAKWDIDFVVPIDPLAYRTQDQYIIVAIDHLTK